MSSAPSWKKLCAEGVKNFRRQDIDGAFKSFDEAILLAKDRSYVPYDTRADVYEKLNCLNYALRDAKKSIDVAPTQWQGYFRSARLLAALGQTDAALEMCSQALLRLDYGPKHESHRRELSNLCQHLEAQPKCHVSGIPVELLLAIFKLSNNPVVVSHVCRQWREVAHSHPTLWRSLVLTAPPEKALRKVQEWHKRSRGRIVELSIRKSLAEALFPSESSLGDPSPMYALTYTEILSTLRHMDLTGLKECHFEDVRAEVFLSKLDASDGMGLIHKYLETLCTSSTGPYYKQHFGGHKYVQLPWENLHVLSITNTGCNWAYLATSMHRLTSFEYKTHDDVINFRHFHLFLKANPGLEKLVVEAVITSSYLDVRTPPQLSYPAHLSPAPEPLTMAHLRHVELKGVLPFRIKSGNFSLPSLRILRITWLEDAALVLSNLIEDEGTSFAELEELTTRARLLGRQVLTAVLLRAPKLAILNCSDLESVVAESLTKPCVALLRDPASEEPELVPTKLPILCPALSVLNLSRSPRLKTDPVVRMVRERIALAASQDGGRYQLPGEDGDRGVSCIRALNVDGCPHIEADMHPWFQENVPEFSCRYDLKRKR